MNRISHWAYRLLGCAVALALLMPCAPHSVHADGFPLPPYGHEGDIQMPAQKAIIVYDAQTQREDLILSVQLLAEVKWLPELDVDKRMKGDYVWFKLGVLF